MPGTKKTADSNFRAPGPFCFPDERPMYQGGIYGQLNGRHVTLLHPRPQVCSSPSEYVEDLVTRKPGITTSRFELAQKVLKTRFESPILAKTDLSKFPTHYNPTIDLARFHELDFEGSPFERAQEALRLTGIATSPFEAAQKEQARGI